MGLSNCAVATENRGYTSARHRDGKVGGNGIAGGSNCCARAMHAPSKNDDSQPFRPHSHTNKNCLSSKSDFITLPDLLAAQRAARHTMADPQPKRLFQNTGKPEKSLHACPEDILQP
jgi:hypothetical protein